MSGQRAEDALNWELGSVSAHHEAGGLKPSTISLGKYDHGGVSYGIFQLSSKSGAVTEYLKWSKSYGPQFEGLEPATVSFNEKWQEVAKSDPKFVLDQRDFIKETHYEPQLDKLKEKGIDLSDRGIAVQESLWSTSVQY